MDYQLKLDGEVDYLDALRRLERIRKELEEEEENKQLDLFGKE
jgi:hypothetical protein